MLFLDLCKRLVIAQLLFGQEILWKCLQTQTRVCYKQKCCALLLIVTTFFTYLITRNKLLLNFLFLVYKIQWFLCNVKILFTSEEKLLTIKSTY